MSDEPPPLIPLADPPTQLSVRVLVVDDNRDAADSTAALLAACGANAVACYDAREAMARVPGFDPEVCILDVNMPGVDGVALAECILVLAGGKPLLVALTGYDDDAARGRIAAGVFDLHFVKPADPAALVAAVEAHVARTRAEA